MLGPVQLTNRPRRIAVFLLATATVSLFAYFLATTSSQSLREKIRLGLSFTARQALPAVTSEAAWISPSRENINSTGSQYVSRQDSTTPLQVHSVSVSSLGARTSLQLAASSASSSLSTSLRPSTWPEVRSSTTHSDTTQAAKSFSGSEPSLGEEQAQLGSQWRPLAASDRYRFTPQTLPPFRKCEQEQRGMNRWKQKLDQRGLKICSGGVSSIVCARELASPRIYVCQFNNVLEVLAGDGTLRWIAQCALHKDVDLYSLFKPLHRSHFLHFLDVRKDLGSQQLSKTITVVQSIPANVDFVDHVLASLKLRAQKQAPAREGVTFLSSGDCNTGNPGHCQADQDNLFIVQHILPKTFSREETRVVLYNGFGRSRYSAQKERLPHFYEDWQALSAEIVTASYSADFPSLKVKAEPYVQLVRYLVSGPAGMTGPHWISLKGSSCLGRSPLLLAHQMAALPFFESRWGSNPDRYGDACNFLKKLSAEYSLHLLNGEACKIDARHSNFYLWISRVDQDCYGPARLTSKCRNRLNRGVSNGLELATELSKRYADTTILYVNTGTIPYLDQVFLIRAASTIIAAHGGGLWNAARWLNEALHQRIVEIVPIGSPGETCSLAKLFGGRYSWVKCHTCKNKQNGELKFEEFFKAVETADISTCQGI
ncbi:agaB34 [Symbiodinium microadriaticum]|nr:agaB34 [Symbiodinium microadriaticum]